MIEYNTISIIAIAIADLLRDKGIITKRSKWKMQIT